MLCTYVAEDKEVADPQTLTKELFDSYPPLNLSEEQSRGPMYQLITNKHENMQVISNKEIKKFAKYALLNDVLYRVVKSKLGNCYNLVVQNVILRDIMYSLYEDHLNGHAGYRKTLDRARMRFYWSKMSKYIKKYCMSCMDYQTKGVNNKLPAGLLQPIPVRGPWSRVSN